MLHKGQEEMGVKSTAASSEVVNSHSDKTPVSLNGGRKKQDIQMLPPSTVQEVPRNQWTIEKSEALYRIEGWGQPYFSINAAGHVTVSPKGDRGGSLDLYELVNALKLRNLGLPLLIRFSDILENRIEILNACFAKAIARYNYPGDYCGVFPVKCNQQRHLIEDLVRFGKPHQFGLEAGSKPELMIALALLDTPGAPLICNGYKDREYIENGYVSPKNWANANYSFRTN